MSINMSKKLFFFIFMLLLTIIYIFSNSSANKIKNNNVANSNEVKMIKTTNNQSRKESSSKLQKQIFINKQKFQNVVDSHEAMLKARKEYLLRESYKRSKYLSYEARYRDARTHTTEQELKSIKRAREQKYQHKYKQYREGKHYEQKMQMHKRAELDKARLKSIVHLQKKQQMHKKYKQGE